MRFIGAAALCVALCGCAGRTPAPVAVVQPHDRFMDCAAILAEVNANNAKVQQLASDQGLKTTQNVVAGVAGFVIPVLWFGMDFQGTADKETQALQARQQYLATLAEQRRCGEPSSEPPPAPKTKKKPIKPKPPAQSEEK
jgi:hypothetical protein